MGEVGLIRTAETLEAALARIREMRQQLEAAPGSQPAAFDLSLSDWYDLRDSLLTAEAVALSACERVESRGAHWRDDFPATDPAFEQNQTVALSQDGLETDWQEVGRR